MRSSSPLTVGPRPPSWTSTTGRIGARGAHVCPPARFVVHWSLPRPLDSRTMTSAVAHLFDAMAATYDDLEPWYEHLYARAARDPAADARPPAPTRRARARRGLRHRLPVRAPRRPGLADPRRRPVGRTARGRPPRLPRAALAQASVEALPFPTRCFDAVVCCGSTLSFVDDPARALAELGRVLRPGGRLLLDCEHRPSLDLAWALASALAGDPLGYGVSARAAWRAVFRPPTASRLPYPGYGPLRLFRRRELDRMLTAAGLGRSARGACTASPTCCHPRCSTASPSPARPRRRLPGPLPARRQLTTTAPALAFANSLALLAIRSQPSA